MKPALASAICVSIFDGPRGVGDSALLSYAFRKADSPIRGLEEAGSTMLGCPQPLSADPQLQLREHHHRQRSSPDVRGRRVEKIYMESLRSNVTRQSYLYLDEIHRMF